MEELLNQLIKKGRKPFGRETKHELSSGVVYDTIDIKGKGDIRVIDRRHHHIRELVSKESGLWQFVCENGMIENGKTVHDYVISHITYSYDKGCGGYAPNNSEFWIMMSALCNEDKLEKFLLDNIKI